jgi:hypothetical protein
MFDENKKYEVANNRISQFCELAEMAVSFVIVLSRTLHEITHMHF